MQIVEGPLAGMFSRAVVVLDENNTVVYREHIQDDIAPNPITKPRFVRWASIGTDRTRNRHMKN